MLTWANTITLDFLLAALVTRSGHSPDLGWPGVVSGIIFRRHAGGGIQKARNVGFGGTQSEIQQERGGRKYMNPPFRIALGTLLG